MTISAIITAAEVEALYHSASAEAAPCPRQGRTNGMAPCVESAVRSDDYLSNHARIDALVSDLLSDH